jgi:hypothetical protein
VVTCRVPEKFRNFLVCLNVTDITFPACSQGFNLWCLLTFSNLLSFKPSTTLIPSNFQCSLLAISLRSSRFFAHGDENSFKGAKPNARPNLLGISSGPLLRDKLEGFGEIPRPAASLNLRSGQFELAERKYIIQCSVQYLSGSQPGLVLRTGKFQIPS